MLRHSSITLLLLLLGTSAAAQSLTAGGLIGTVRDDLGRPMDGAAVTVLGRGTGLVRTVTTTHGGSFEVQLVPPGDYDVLVERLGYRPHRIMGVPVRPGVSSDVSVHLNPAPPPVMRVDSSRYAAAALQGAVGTTQWFDPQFLDRLPDRSRTLLETGRLSSVTTTTLETEGLSPALSGIVIEGIPFRQARHPGLPADEDPPSFPRSAFDQTELEMGGPDVEWSSFAGGTLGTFMPQGGAGLSAHGFADWKGNSLTSSKVFDPGSLGGSSVRGGVVVAGSIIPDTARFALGFEAQRLHTPFPAVWRDDPSNAALLAAARDSFGLDLTPYTRPRISSVTVATGFGSFAWQVSRAHSLTVGVHFATSQSTDPLLGEGPAVAPSLDAKLDATDLLAGATLSSALSPRFSQELRIGVSSSTRDYTRGPLPATVVGDPGVAFGSDATLPGRFQRTAVFARDAVHLAFAPHRLKVGFDLTVPSYQQTYGYARNGEFVFGSVADFAAQRGMFVQTVGASSEADFSVPQFGGFLQDTWTLAPGFDFLIGFRMDVERLPRGNVRSNDAWRLATGLQNTALPANVSRVTPRFGFLWDIAQRHAWLVSGEAGMYADVVDPSLLAELVTHSGSQQVRRGVGVLSAWPGTPDSASAPVRSPDLALLGPDFQAPRSKRVVLTVTGGLSPGTVLRLSAAYRHTDFLPRRHDLNRPLAPSGTDQYGRPLSGPLVQQGSLVEVSPGANRRFQGFDLVSALDPDGFADYRAVTLALEHHEGRGLGLLASYTFSRTRDNWLSGRGAGAGGGPAGQLNPFPDSLAGADWAEGRSDFDVPHRVVLAVSFTAPRLSGLHLAAVYRYRSGYPFTPGFRPGVDANGDGSDRNDPAFVDDTMTSLTPLLDQWSCLRQQAGRFAERNSCRAPGVHALDFRLALSLLRIGGYPFTLVVDGLNLIESDAGPRDGAVYLVDRTRALATNPATGVTTVPLVANPNFGRVLAHDTPGRQWRVGLQVNY
jgi:hypothetical protein